MSPATALPSSHRPGLMLSRRLHRQLLNAALGLLVLAGLALRAQSPVPLPNGVDYVTTVEGISEYRLKNGLRVVLFADPTKSNITVNITYLVGSRHEDYGETGMAHLLEHLLFMGSTNHPNIKKELQDHGTRPNGTTWFDRTNYFETFAATDENLKWALELEADRMVNSFVAKKDLDSEMSVVRNELERGENSPSSVLFGRTLATAFLWHNYGHLTIGARSDLERVPIDRLQAFYRHFYQPDNAFLVVAGKIDEAKTLALVDATFSPIPKPTRQLRKTYTAEPVQDGERSVTLRRAGDVQALLAIYHVPPAPHEEFVPLQMATSILGATPSGRLHKALVEPGLAVSAGANAYQLAEPGFAYASATVRTEKSLDDALAAMLGAIDAVKTKPFTDEEVNRAKTQWLKSVELMMNDSQRTALQLSEWQAMGDWRLLFLQRDRVKAVTREQIQRAAEKYLIASNRTVGKFIPDKSPIRAEVPEAPDVAALLKDYRGDTTIAQGEEFDASPENIDRLTRRIDLPGGLKLALLPKKTRGERVNAQISLHWGDEHSRKGLTTAAMVSGSMLMRGTTRFTRQQLRDEIDRLKAQVSVSGTSASVQTTKQNLAEVLALVAHIWREPSFPEKEFEQLRQQYLAGYENQKNDPNALASNRLYRHLRPVAKDDVRYIQTVEERIAALNAVTLEQVRAYHRDFYGASHGEIVIVGDFDADAVAKQIAGLFGDWKTSKPYARIAYAFPTVSLLADVIDTPDKSNAQWLAAIPVRMTDAHPDYPALVLGNAILGSGMNSRLFQRVRTKEGLSYGVSSGFSASPKDDDAQFTASASSAPQNTPKVEAVFKEELAKLLAEGFTDEEVEARKKSWLDSRKVGRANDSELTSRLLSHLYWGRTMMSYDAALEAKVAALTPAQIQAAMKRHLDVAKLNIVRAGDFKKAGVTWNGATAAGGTQ